MTLHQFSSSDIHLYQQFVDAHNDANAYHNMAWGKAVEKAYGFDSLYFGLKQNGEITAVMPAVLMKTLKGKKLICSLPYCDLGGILALSNEASSALKNAVVDYALKHACEFEFRDTITETMTNNANISENSSPEATGDKASGENIADGTKVRMIYSLLDDVDAQMKSFKPKLRSQIKKASKNGVKARVVAKPSASDIDKFYEVFATNMRDLGSPVHAKDWFTQIFASYDEQAFLVLVDIDDKCIGGGIVIHTQHKAVIPWASTLRSHNKLAPNMLLYWEVLAQVIERGIRNFDFGRSGYNEGTYRFKKQWGALPVALQWESLVDDKLQAEKTSDKSALRAKIENIWQKMPLGVTTAIGPKIRKYISL
jgi:FemAB-related protein (PEP-CTERM system-associated)